MKFVLAILAVAFAGFAFGQASEVKNANPETERRLKLLAEELRCLVCQNQTIADSHATLAADLRNQIREQIAQGRSDTDIRDYMVARYGDFVLYRPPFKATTALLWLGPFILVAVGIGAFLVIVRRRRSSSGEVEPTAKRRAEIERLLDDKA
jgi:cytochrome c-type biogenesis protein CcmH